MKRLLAMLMVIVMMIGVIPSGSAASGDHTFTHLDVRIENVSLTMSKKIVNLVTGEVIKTETQTITASLTKVEYVTINGVTYNSFYAMDEREWRQSNVKINLSTLTDTSTAVLVVDLVDADGNTYDNVSITYNRAGIQYAMEHCDGYKNGEYDGIDFDPSQGTNNIIRIEYDDYVIPVQKVWDDANNQDGVRPSSVTINLLADGIKVDSVVLNESNGWKYLFEDKPSHDASGNEIEYTIDEDSVPSGYIKTSIDNDGTYLTVTNTHTTEVTEKTVTKVWADNDDQDGIRPDSVTVQLMNGSTVVGTAELNEGNNWSHTFTNLPKNAAGQEIEYTVAERTVPDGYYPEVVENEDGTFTITNTHTPETIDIFGSKTWNDNENQDGKRPTSITINLLANGTHVDSETVTAEDGWTWSFTGLDKYADGKEIKYTITENEVKDYIATVNGFNVTNTHKLDTIDISVKKEWVDANNQDGLRKEVTIHLLADNVDTGKTLTLNESNQWTGSFTGLTKNKEGAVAVPVVYTITEDAVVGYGAPAITGNAAEGFTVTNTHTPETVEISGSKTWNDNNNQDGKRPTSITINLMANDTKVASKTVTEADGWAWSFTDLDKFADGNEITYTITEDEVAGYTTEVDGYNVTNTHTPETTEISVVKKWDDGDNRDNKRPKSVTITLLKNNVATEHTLVLSNDNDWSGKFENLAKYEGGQLITYTISENSIEGYTPKITGDAATGFTVTNSYTPEETSVKVMKVWEDDNNRDNIRPSDITVKLLADGVETGKTLTLSSGNDWTDTFTGLAKNKNGNPIEYKIEEVAVDNYDVEITGDAANGFTITNTHTPETVTISGTKTWNDKNDQDGKRPESITVNLMADGTQVNSQTVTPDANGNWTWSFTVPKYNNGVEIKYSVVEVLDEEAAEIYNATYPDGTYDIVNTYSPETVNILVVKNWADNFDQDGKRPESITVKLLADGKETDETLVLNEDNNWRASFEELDKFKSGTAIVYTVEEAEVPEGYTASVVDNQNGTITITNTHEPETTEVVGKKTWNDADDQDGKRPDSITVKLLADGKVVDTKSVTAEDSWIYKFDNLPVYDAGTEIVYTVEETVPAGYKATYDGYNITNTYSPEEINIKVTKSWVDSKDADGIRPDKVTIYLYANGEKTGDKLILTAKDKWTGSFTDLPKYEDGKEIKYTISEKDVKGYKAVIKGSAADGFTVTNSHSTIPTTGDERTPILWISMMAIGLLAVVIAISPIFKKKGKYSR